MRTASKTVLFFISGASAVGRENARCDALYGGDAVIAGLPSHLGFALREEARGHQALLPVQPARGAQERWPTRCGRLGAGGSGITSSWLSGIPRVDLQRREADCGDVGRRPDNLPREGENGRSVRVMCAKLWSVWRFDGAPRPLAP